MNIKRYTTKLTLLLGILLLAFFLRFVGLNDFPSGFHGDEASFLLNTKAILATGHDEDKQFLPLYIRSFIDPQPALYSYAQVPFVALMGTTHAAARLPAVLFGVASIYLIYLLIRKRGGESLALLSAALLAISPWHIMLSRGSQQVMMALVFGLIAIYCLLRILDSKKTSWIYFAMFLFSFFLSLYAYHSAKIILPLLVAYLFFVYLRGDKARWKMLFFLAIGTAIAFVLGTLVTGFVRVNAVSIFSNPSTQLLLDEKIRTATVDAPYMIIRVFNNKLIDYTLALLNNYSEYFTMKFLFLQGGQPLRYLIPFHGLFYVFEVLFLITGLYSVKNEKDFLKGSGFFIFWLLVAPVAASFTTEEIPSMTRTFFMIVPLIYFIAKGLLMLWNYKATIVPQVILRGGILALYVLGFCYFLFMFFIQQPNYHPWYRDYGSEQLPKAVMPLLSRYDQIFISTNQYVYFTLADALSLSDIQDHYPKRLQKVSTYGKIIFVNDNCVFVRKEKVLSIVKSDCKLREADLGGPHFEEVGAVRYKDTVPAYTFYRYTKPKEKETLY